MKLTTFNKPAAQRVSDLNKYLKENFGISVKGFHPKAKLEKVREQAQNKIISIKNTNKRFQLDPEYAKYLGVKDVIDVMLGEGMYAESPAYESMCNEVKQTVQELMDGGYTDEEACSECMNRFRKDSRYAYDDQVIMPLVLKATKDYMESCSMSEDSVMDEALAEFVSPETDLTEYLLSELAKECGVELNSMEIYNAIEEKVNTFAEVTGKSRDAVVGFLNGLDEEALVNGIQMFGKKIAERNLLDSIQYMHKLKNDGKSVEEIAQELDMSVDAVKDAMSKTESVEESENMFDDIIGSMLSEEVEVEQAEVVMALRALADDVQDHIERIGRMMNEDIPAIADQMSAEFGAEQAAQMKSSMEASLGALLDANKMGKEGIDATVGSLTGVGSMAGAGMDQQAGLAEPELDAPVDNVPAAAGPEEEPMGRAPVDVDAVEEI